MIFHLLIMIMGLLLIRFFQNIPPRSPDDPQKKTICQKHGPPKRGESPKPCRRCRYPSD